jgi:hypothetical protein
MSEVGCRSANPEPGRTLEVGAPRQIVMLLIMIVLLIVPGSFHHRIRIMIRSMSMNTTEATELPGTIAFPNRVWERGWEQGSK